MPAKSKAQLRAIAAKLGPEKAREWAAETPNLASLPERLPKKKSKKR